MSQNYKELAERLKAQRVGAPDGKRAAVKRDAPATPQKHEVSDKAAQLMATALKDFLR